MTRKCLIYTGVYSILCMLFQVPVVAAKDWLGTDTQLNGFLSQAFVKSTHHNFYGNSTQGSFGLTEVGANMHHRLDPRLSASMQVISRRAGEMDNGALRVDYAFLDYRYHSDVNGFAGMRLGRSKVLIGFYNETRDVAVTRPGIMMPQSIYLEGLGLRDFFLSTDGVMGYVNWFGQSNHAWQMEFGTALPQDLSTQTRDAFLANAQATGDMRMDSAQLARSLYEWDGGRLRLGATGIRMRNSYKPGHDDMLGPDAIEQNVFILSSEWNTQRLTLTAEGVYRYFSIRNIMPEVDYITQQNGYYLQANYRFLPGWEAFLRYDTHWHDRRDKSGKRQAIASAMTGRVQPAHAFYQNHHVVGLSWRVAPGWLLRTEWHDIRGTALTPYVDNPHFSSRRGKANWDLFALQVAYSF